MYFRKVLVGLDLENHDLSCESELPPAARSLFERVVEIAAAQNAELRLCSVVDGLDLTKVPVSPQQVALFGGVLASRLEGLDEEAHESGIDCESSLIGGDVRQELGREIEEWQPDLLVLGAGSHPSRLGTTAAAMMKSAKCPVLIERPRSEPAPSTLGNDESEPLHVLLADDLGERFGFALMNFVASGLWRDAKCWLTHVVEPDRWPEAWQAGLSLDAVTARQTERAEAARRKLHEHLAPTDHRTMTYGILPHVVEGNFIDSVSRLISEWKIDLLVCGPGPQTETLCANLSCSVLVWTNGE